MEEHIEIDGKMHKAGDLNENQLFMVRTLETIKNDMKNIQRDQQTLNHRLAALRSGEAGFLTALRNSLEA